MAKPCEGCGGPKPKGRGRKRCDDCTGCEIHATMQNECADCRKRWYNEDPERRQRARDASSRSRKRRMYGIDDDELDVLLGVTECYVCGSGDDLCIDHSHTTGEVRKVLCRYCNLTLGHAKDNPELLRKLADYLEEH